MRAHGVNNGDNEPAWSNSTFEQLFIDRGIEYTSAVPYSHQNPHIERSWRTTAGNVRACMLDKDIRPSLYKYIWEANVRIENNLPNAEIS